MGLSVRGRQIRAGFLMQRVLLTVMLGAIGGPLPFSVLVYLSPTGVHQILASPPLTDNSPQPERPQLSFATWWRGDFQRGVESWFGDRVEPRGRIVRLTNEVYYRLFAKSYMYNRTIVVGREGHLYELGYLKAYCRSADRLGRGGSASLLAKLSEVLPMLERSDRWLLFLLTPSKPVIMPEFLPRGVCDGLPASLAERARFLTSLRSAGIPVIDGPGVTQTMKVSDPLPPFPRGGTHWSRLVGARVSTTVMEAAKRRSGRDMGQLSVDPPRWNAAPTGADIDLARLLNLWRPPLDYPAPSVAWRCGPTAAGRDTRLVAVGGSFLEQVLEPIAACALFGRIDYYNYYDKWRREWPGRRILPVDRAAIRWQEELSRPTVVLLELNESSIIGNGAPHLELFLDDLRVALR